jgi:hypothetical protein
MVLPKRIFLTTYNRLEHLKTTRDSGVVGVRADATSSARKANGLRIDDWILIRISDPAYKDQVDHLLVTVARVAAGPILIKPGRSDIGPWPELLWEEEKEKGSVVFPFRVPVSFVDVPKVRSAAFTWESLAAIGLRDSSGEVLATSQQWGVKFRGNMIDAPREVRSLTELIERSQ